RAFLAGVREVTRRFGVPLIFDEIVTGFRFAYGGAQEYYGVVPDIAALGKIIGGGFPLAAVVGSEEIMRHLAPAMEDTGDFVQQAGTLNGNPRAARAGAAPPPPRWGGASRSCVTSPPPWRIQATSCSRRERSTAIPWPPRRGWPPSLSCASRARMPASSRRAVGGGARCT